MLDTYSYESVSELLLSFAKLHVIRTLARVLENILESVVFGCALFGIEIYDIPEVILCHVRMSSSQNLDYSGSQKIL